MMNRLMNRTYTGVLPFLLAAGLAGCDGARSSSPTAPSTVEQRPVPAPDQGRVGVTLFGVVFETTETGQMAIADVSVYCDACGVEGHTWLRTDANGYYSFSGDFDAGGGIWLSNGPKTVVLVAKEGYKDPPGLTYPPYHSPGAREVTINGDTRFDIELVRR